MTLKLISIIVPVFNEELVLEEFYKRLQSTLHQVIYESEIIFIDDGSSDRSLEVIEEIALQDKRVKYLSFSRNFGHQKALAAGLDHANGNAVISIDADLQHPPELIPDLLKKWEEGHDIVYTIRNVTADSTVFKNVTSKLFYKVMNLMSSVEVVPGASDFRLVDRKVCDVLASHKERERFYRGMVQWVGFKQSAVMFNADARFAGTTGYSLKKMLSFALDGLLSYSYVPIYFVIILSTILVLLAAGYMLFALSIFLKGGAILGQTSIIMSILLIGSVQLLALTVNSFYVYKIYQEVKARPLYITNKSFGFD